ncbi:MAG: hypothetical protein E6Q97_09740 [Desulfurellales bacterium]|nr:MAG: hypothetical protein E6Q97_09740 [Desulfurellales bacterium]
MVVNEWVYVMIIVAVFIAWIIMSLYYHEIRCSFRKPNILHIDDELEASSPAVLPFPDGYTNPVRVARQRQAEPKVCRFAEGGPEEGTSFAFVDPDDAERWIVGYCEWDGYTTNDGRKYRTDTAELSYWVPLPQIPV